MMLLNWRKGLLRLWVLGAGVWIVFVGCLFFSSLQEAFKISSPDRIKRSLTLAMSYQDGSMQPEKRAVYEAALRRGLLPSITPDATGSVMIVALKDGLKIRVPKDAEVADFEAAFKSLLIEKRNKKILEVVFWAVIPPSTLLIFSWLTSVLVAWVIRGFRSVDA